MNKNKNIIYCKAKIYEKIKSLLIIPSSLNKGHDL